MKYQLNQMQLAALTSARTLVEAVATNISTELYGKPKAKPTVQEDAAVKRLVKISQAIENMI